MGVSKKHRRPRDFPRGCRSGHEQHQQSHILPELVVVEIDDGVISLKVLISAPGCQHALGSSSMGCIMKNSNNACSMLVGSMIKCSTSAVHNFLLAALNDKLSLQGAGGLAWDTTDC